jgi:bile acid:Na+ symporter, BASS family
MQQARKLCLLLAIVSLLVLMAGVAAGKPAVWQPAAVATAIGVAFGLGAVGSLRTYQFTGWIVAGCVVAMIYPERLLHFGPIDLRDKRIILTMMQLVMFAMGTQMSLRDLVGVVRMPYAVFVGITLQFTVMPLMGFVLATSLGFPPEVAAGVVLIGSCSSGLASNVMTFIAKANLPLSITLTTVATLLAPIMTPLWMKVLASEMVPVDFVAMMLEIVKMVIVPIGAAMLADFLEHASSRARSMVFTAAAAAAIVLAIGAFGGWDYATANWSGNTLTALGVAGFLLGAIVAGAVYYQLKALWPQIARVMPVAAMFGIVYVTSVTTAAGRDRLLDIGWLLVIAVAIHNTSGYVLGYWVSRALGLDERSARTVALEVGLQNGGMAATIAAAKGQLATLGLAAAVFNPWMNTSGSILANYWRKRPLDDEPDLSSDAPTHAANGRQRDTD